MNRPPDDRFAQEMPFRLVRFRPEAGITESSRTAKRYSLGAGLQYSRGSQKKKE